MIVTCVCDRFRVSARCADWCARGLGPSCGCCFWMFGPVQSCHIGICRPCNRSILLQVSGDLQAMDSGKPHESLVLHVFSITPLHPRCMLCTPNFAEFVPHASDLIQQMSHPHPAVSSPSPPPRKKDDPPPTPGGQLPSDAPTHPDPTTRGTILPPYTHTVGHCGNCSAKRNNTE